MAQSTYQIEEVQDFLSFLQLLPLNDVLRTNGRIFVTGDHLTDLQELYKTTALGIKCIDVEIGGPVLWLKDTGAIMMIFHCLFRTGLSTEHRHDDQSFHSLSIETTNNDRRAVTDLQSDSVRPAGGVQVKGSHALDVCSEH